MNGAAPLYNALMLRSKPLEFFSDLAATGEKISRIILPAGCAYLVNDPAAVAHLLLDRTGKLRKYAFPGISEAFGTGILNSAGEQHAVVRQTAQPHFHRPQIEEWSATVKSMMADAVAQLEGGNETDIKAFFERNTLTIVGRLVFALDLSQVAERFFDNVEQLQQTFQQIETSPVAAARFHAASRSIDQLLQQVLREQPSAWQNGPLLRALRATNKLSETQILTEIRVFLMASLPASMLLGTACWLLAAHPDEQAALRRNGTANLTENVVNETLRLYPPGWLLGREAVEPFQLADCSFESGTVLLVCLWSLHRSPRNFPEPDRFWPERWKAKMDHPKGAFIPFSLGARNCPGERLSRMIAEHGLRLLLKSFALAPSSRHDQVRWLPRITLSPASGIWLKLRRNV